MTTIYTDPLGIKLTFDPTRVYPMTPYSVIYPPNRNEAIPTTEPEDIPFQSGTFRDNGVNGVTNELLIAAVRHRIEELNNVVGSPYNELTIKLLTMSLELLSKRDKERSFTALVDTHDDTDTLHEMDRVAVAHLRAGYISEVARQGCQDILNLIAALEADLPPLDALKIEDIQIPAIRKQWVQRNAA